MNLVEQKLKELGYKLREGFTNLYSRGKGYCIYKICYVPEKNYLDGFADINPKYIYTINDSHIKRGERIIKRDLKILEEVKRNEL